MLYEARLQDLGPGDFVNVECTACGHAELLASDMLRIKGLELPPYTPVLDLEPKLRCRECDARGGTRLDQMECTPRRVIARLPPKAVDKMEDNGLRASCLSSATFDYI